MGRWVLGGHARSHEDSRQSILSKLRPPPLTCTRSMQQHPAAPAPRTGRPPVLLSTWHCRALGGHGAAEKGCGLGWTPSERGRPVPLTDSRLEGGGLGAGGSQGNTGW